MSLSEQDMEVVDTPDGGFVVRYALKGNPTVECRATGQLPNAFRVIIHDYRTLELEGGAGKVPHIDEIGFIGSTREEALSRAKTMLSDRWALKLVADAERRLDKR